MLTVNFHHSLALSAFRMWICTAGEETKENTLLILEISDVISEFNRSRGRRDPLILMCYALLIFSENISRCISKLFNRFAAFRLIGRPRLFQKSIRQFCFKMFKPEFSERPDWFFFPLHFEASAIKPIICGLAVEKSYSVVQLWCSAPDVHYTDWALWFVMWLGGKVVLLVTLAGKARWIGWLIRPREK